MSAKESKIVKSLLGYFGILMLLVAYFFFFSGALY